MLDKTILITGFGPFGSHDVNASWEAVQLIEELNFDGYKIIKHEVPVTYKYVDENISKLWELHKPTFVLHVGVSTPADHLTLETVANRSGYRQLDASGTAHPTGEVCPPHLGPDVHNPVLDVDRIIDEVQDDKLRFVKSTYAGLFLCEYIFYTSLNVDKKRILFSHVPKIGEPYTVQELAEGLTRIINAALRQLEESEKIQT